MERICALADRSLAFCQLSKSSNVIKSYMLGTSWGMKEAIPFFRQLGLVFRCLPSVVLSFAMPSSRASISHLRTSFWELVHPLDKLISQNEYVHLGS